ncbi:hypothetical protein NC653_018169 [Populus alba x Populus x berolinensis]|uniref:Uncharacterized protein n=1 Tax=Populus alba x Populus x berolinensis TaxID=444605 RepID=A0AAD6QFU2_9ROSI|nr:hypothetical protein NC653_018169 [Populus alba x Populus x berolinensis]
MKLEAASYATFVMALCRRGRVVKAYEQYYADRKRWYFQAFDRISNDWETTICFLPPPPLCHQKTKT